MPIRRETPQATFSAFERVGAQDPLNRAVKSRLPAIQPVRCVSRPSHTKSSFGGRVWHKRAWQASKQRLKDWKFGTLGGVVFRTQEEDVRASPYVTKREATPFPCLVSRRA